MTKTSYNKKCVAFICILVLVGTLVFTIGCSAVDFTQDLQQLAMENKQNDGLEREFFNLADAYDAGLLTQEDLLSIAYYHHSQLHLGKGIDCNAELMVENYQPIKKSPEKLSEEQEKNIKQSLLSELEKEFPEESLSQDNISFWQYYGTYNGSVAIRIVYSNGDQIPMYDVEVEDIVAGVTFCYPAYKSFFSLSNFCFDTSIIIWKANS